MVLDRLCDPIMCLLVRFRYHSGMLKDVYHHEGTDIDIFSGC